MRWFFAFLLICLLFSEGHQLAIDDCIGKEDQVSEYLQNLENVIKERRNKENVAFYNYLTNITQENQRVLMEISLENSQLSKEVAQEIRQFGVDCIENDWLRRQMKKLTEIRYSVLEPQDIKRLSAVRSAMHSNYGKVRLCSYRDSSKCDLSLEPEIEDFISNSRDPEELKYYWKEWYDHAGTAIRQPFETYLELAGKAAKLNGYESQADDWIQKYEDPNFVEHLERAYDGIMPLYKKLHAFVRYRLRQKYGDAIVSVDGPIPMHLLGNMWGQTWDRIMDIITPFPDRPHFDLTAEMVRQNYTAVKMFEMGDEFFQSLNMTKLPQIFWEKSVLEKPTDGRNIVCHASAWDMSLKDDVRIKQCTRVTISQFYTVHHELGHIQYYLQYQDLPTAFRGAPNPGFHEAVGDVLALSVSTPKHLKKIGLLQDYTTDFEDRMNDLFTKAVKKIVILPFAYTLDKYRWALFRGEINSSNYNCAFWKMRSDFSGVEPPVERSELDFDPPAKYHISSDVEYLRYFTAHIFQFQFLKAACIKAGQYVPGDQNLTLDNCDIHGSSETGNAFKAMLSLGASKHWKDALEIFTGDREMTADAILDYFAPLGIWLDKEIDQKNIPIGWTPSHKCKTDGL